MSIIVSDTSFHYPNQDNLLDHLSFSIQQNRKVALIGNNGAGKTTLLKLLAGILQPSAGSIQWSAKPYYIPQQLGPTNFTVAEAIGIEKEIEALEAINNGSIDQAYFDLLDNKWDIESKCRQALNYWGLNHIDLTSTIDTLSGGEKNKVYLAASMVHSNPLILMDEPTNHLDLTSRTKLYDFITNTKATLIIVSHDVTLLNLLDTTYELSEKGIKLYGGNYDFYKEQKKLEEKSIAQQISSEKASLRLAKKKAQEVRERQDKRSSQGGKNKSKEGVPTIVLNSLSSHSENSTAKLINKHSDIIESKLNHLTELNLRQRKKNNLKLDLKDAQLHNGKLLIEAKRINFGYLIDKHLWTSPLNFEIRSGDRLHLKGDNGAGKSTLIKLITNELSPSIGEIKRADFSFIYIDQEFKIINSNKTILELANDFNPNKLHDNEIKTMLNRALFPQETWDNYCTNLSGGERMRLYLCCLMISNQIPDMIILDEPSNNLDLPSLEILIQTIKSYNGTILVISHDNHFINNIGITETISVI